MISACQPEFPELFEDLRHHEDPVRDWIEGWLRDHSGWHGRPELVAASSGRLHDRMIRAAMSRSARVVSGQQGYKHLDHATPEEVHAFLADLMSRIRALGRRYQAVRRQAHAVIG